jgi:hypothetical protein
MPIQGVVPSSQPLGSWVLVFLFLLDLVPVPEKLSSRMNVLVWVCKCLSCLRIPQVYKELLSRVFPSSKEPLLVSDLDVLDYVREVRDPLPLSHLNTLDRGRSVFLQPKVKGPIESEDLRDLDAVFFSRC